MISQATNILLKPCCSSRSYFLQLHDHRFSSSYFDRRLYALHQPASLAESVLRSAGPLGAAPRFSRKTDYLILEPPSPQWLSHPPAALRAQCCSRSLVFNPFRVFRSESSAGFRFISSGHNCESRNPLDKTFARWHGSRILWIKGNRASMGPAFLVALEGACRRRGFPDPGRTRVIFP